MGHLIAYKKYRTQVTKAEKVLAGLRLNADQPRTNTPANTPAKEKTVWDERMAWIDAGLPEMPSRDQAQAALLEDMRATAKAFDLDIDGQSFVKPAFLSHLMTMSLHRALYVALADSIKAGT